ncbi:MAG: helix-turn-helix domain-containing protein [cyanobacterium endosymbiont of Rhopalodia musculus]|uniref:helix-turn-helix domain-containing protein n=1 Tax=cyanobacterium endosymbiont of Epithemia clementina EcSB TaxID=3034674 RepID=UPI00247FD2FD|nr:helix-turn-helix domain-containing protein [cyanobacterium endosymbiont of Epithemia clementina EcSB]WGT66669.1 helix-turn-helix domain-containing protein [cyanobacterium endosymbiont of Epithemia clementina EcSB]
MSRKKPSVNPFSDSPSKIERSEISPRKGSITFWRRLVAKIYLNILVTENQTGELTEMEYKVDSPVVSSLRGIKRLLSRLRWDKKTSSYDFEQVQHDILADIGAQLNQARREQNISLEAVAADTFISLGLLKSLENGILKDLPEPIYVRGLIRKVADYLGLNGRGLANSFPPKMAENSSRFSRVQISFPTFELRPLHLYFIYIAIVILSVEGISNHLKRTALELEMGKVYQSSPRSSLSVTVSSDQSSSVNQQQKVLQKKVCCDGHYH